MKWLACAFALPTLMSLMGCGAGDPEALRAGQVSQLAGEWWGPHLVDASIDAKGVQTGMHGAGSVVRMSIRSDGSFDLSDFLLDRAAGQLRRAGDRILLRHDQDDSRSEYAVLWTRFTLTRSQMVLRHRVVRKVGDQEGILPPTIDKTGRLVADEILTIGAELTEAGTVNFAAVTGGAPSFDAGVDIAVLRPGKPGATPNDGAAKPATGP